MALRFAQRLRSPEGKACFGWPIQYANCSLIRGSTQSYMAKAENEKADSRWHLVNGDEYGTDVQYQVSRKAQGLAVRAVDRFDCERAQAYHVTWDGEGL